MEFSELLGKTLTSITVRQDEIILCADGENYRMYHSQDCCESVIVEDVSGDLRDLIGYPLTKAEESSNRDSIDKEAEGESFTWTFYHLATVNGYVTIRWLGTSNGYYSESVSFEKVE